MRLAKKNGVWMLAIEELSKAEGLTATLDPTLRRFKAEGKDFSCSFVLGFSYIYANGKALRLSEASTYEEDAVWTPAKETADIFSAAFSKACLLDTANQILKIPVQETVENSSVVVQTPSAAAPQTEQVLSKPEPPPKAQVPEAQAKANASPTPKTKTVSPSKSTSVTPKKNAPAGSREVKTIIIDPGHGGKDPGAIGLISKEKDIVLAVALKLKKELSAKGFSVKLTRSTDVFIQLSERPQLANKWNGDLFISLHCNAIDGNKERKKKTKGFRIYVLRDPESEEDRAIARRENKVAKTYGDKNTKDELSPLDWLKIQARLEQYKHASYIFTEKAIHTYESGKISKMGSGAGGAGFMVLVGAFMPATLVELGFISNPEEEKYMNSEKGQQEMAKRLAQGVEAYKKAIDEYLKTLSR